MPEETLEAKLRNQLSPIYGLADMVLLIDAKPEMKQIVIDTAKQVVANKKRIDSLLIEIEAKYQNSPVSSVERDSDGDIINRTDGRMNNDPCYG